MNELFRIYQITAEDAAEIAASPDRPHQHDFEELIIGVEGEVEHFIDFKTTRLRAPCICFVSKGKTHRVVPHLQTGETPIWVLRFRESLIPDLAFHLYALYHDSANFEMKNDDHFKRMVTLCELISMEMNQATPDMPVARDLLRALLGMVKAQHEKQTWNKSSIRSTQNTTYMNFLMILEENFTRDVGVEFYAEKLFMTSRNLNLVCQSVVNKSVSEIIEERKIVQGMNLLATTDKTISEIGYEIGYNDKSCFTTVFRKKNGQTPTEFRKHVKRMIS